MKKRRIVLAAFLLIAVLVMGIGYAAITKNLEFQGTAQVGANEGEFKVKLVNPVVAGATPGVSAVATSDTSIRITIDKGVLNTVGDKVTVTADIVNDSDYYAALVNAPNIQTTSAKSYVNASVTKTSDGSAITGSQLTVTDGTEGGNDTLSITVEIELVDLPNGNYESTFTITIPVESVEG